MSAAEIRRQFATYVERQTANPATGGVRASAFAASLDALDDIIAGRMSDQLTAAELIEASHE